MHIARDALVLAVIGAGGGAGASTFAAATAVRAAAGGLVVCAVDLAAGAGGLDVVLGLEASPGLRWGDLTGAEGEIPGPSLCEQLPALDGGPMVLAHGGEVGTTGDLPERVVRALSGCCDLVVLDVATGAATLPNADETLLVVRGCVPGVAAAGAACRRLSLREHRARVVTRDAPRHTAVQIAEALDLEPAAALASDRSLDGDLLRGRPPGQRRRSALARAADAVLDSLPVAQETPA